MVKMTKDQWREHHNLTHGEMVLLEAILVMCDGKITAVVENTKREVLRVI